MSVVGAMLFGASPSHAQQARPDAGVESEAPREWYGGPLIAAYVVPAALLVPTKDDRDAPGAQIALALGAPAMVHVANGRVLAGLGSIGGSVIGSMLGGAVGFAAQPCSITGDIHLDLSTAGGGGAEPRPSRSHGCDGAFYGMLAGYLAWGAFDVGVIAHKRVSRPLAVTPTASVARERVTLGVSGTF